MLCVPLLLTGLSGLQEGVDSERLREQITIPEKIRSLYSEGFVSHVSYNIVIEGRTYTVNLNQSVFATTKGILKVIQSLWWPLAHVLDSGLIQFENTSYRIEPLEPSTGFEHIIYQVKPKSAGISLYTEKDAESREVPYIQSIEPFTELTQYLEMHVVVKNNMCTHMGLMQVLLFKKSSSWWDWLMLFFLHLRLE